MGSSCLHYLFGSKKKKVRKPIFVNDVNDKFSQVLIFANLQKFSFTSPFKTSLFILSDMTLSCQQIFKIFQLEECTRTFYIRNCPEKAIYENTSENISDYFSKISGGWLFMNHRTRLFWWDLDFVHFVKFRKIYVNLFVLLVNKI